MRKIFLDGNSAFANVAEAVAAMTLYVGSYEISKTSSSEAEISSIPQLQKLLILNPPQKSGNIKCPGINSVGAESDGD